MAHEARPKMISLRWNFKYTGWMAAGLLALLAAAPTLKAQDFNQPDPNQPGMDDPNAVDPPTRVARVSVLQGNVSLEPASVQQFNAAELNYPMTTGDRIYADVGAVAELQTGQIAVRLGQQTDLTVTAMTDTLAQFGLAQGSVHLRTFNVYQGEAVELDTPSVAVTVLQAGDVRINVDPSTGDTTIGVFSGQVQVNGNNVQQVLEPGEWVLVAPNGAQPIRGMQADGLDSFSAQRDGLYLNAMATEQQYVNPGTIGAEDLSGYGTWQDSDDGPVWYPANVAVGWQPYQDGHWAWVAPWGWTWIEYEPWGFAPFHYGRWGHIGGRWGWMPGPPIARPVYSPALVTFVGGANFSIGGVGVTAWFPLGPGEVYHPWYHASGLYTNRVNVSNIYNRNVTQVRNIYNQRTVVNNYTVVNNTYANRQVGTVAVSHDTFAGGRRVQGAQVHADAQQMAGAQVLPHPIVSPERGTVIGTPARAVPPVMSRPVLASHEDTAVRPGTFVNRGAQPQPAQPQIQRQQPNPVLQNAPQQRQQQFQQLQPVQQRPTPPVQQPQVQQRPTPQQPEVQQRPVQQQPEVQQRPIQPVQQPQIQQQPRAPQQVQQPAPQQPVQQEQQRVLFNKAVPPPPRPSFDQQRQAIQQNDPGRPLGPQQLNNLRENRPAGPPQQAEQPHPQPQAPHNDMQRPTGPPKK